MDPVTATDGRGLVALALTTVTPVYNEAPSITTFLQECHEAVIQRWGGRFLVCEDGSTDGTSELLAKLAPDLRITVHSCPLRKGYAGAVRDGLSLTDTPWVFFTDSDGQYDPQDFDVLRSAITDCDMVIGRKVQRRERFYRGLLSYGFHCLARAFTDVPLNDMDCGFRLIRREVIQAVLSEVRSLPYSFWAEFSIIAYRRGFRIREVPISHRARLVGSSSIYRWNKLPRILAAQVLGLLRLGARLNRDSETSYARRRSGLPKSS